MLVCGYMSTVQLAVRQLKVVLIIAGSLAFLIAAVPYFFSQSATAISIFKDPFLWTALACAILLLALDLIFKDNSKMGVLSKVIGYGIIGALGWIVLTIIVVVLLVIVVLSAFGM